MEITKFSDLLTDQQKADCQALGVDIDAEIAGRLESLRRTVILGQLRTLEALIPQAQQLTLGAQQTLLDVIVPIITQALQT